MEHDKPSGVAAAQAAATDIGLAIQTVEGFPTKQLQWEMVGKDTDGTPIYRNNWGEYSPWIPVSERLPERNEIVLATDQDGVTVGSYSPMLDDWWALHGDRMAPGAVVTYWMPLPEPPEVK